MRNLLLRIAASRTMVLIRRFEEKVGEMYLRAKIGGYCHLNLGEEATVAGAIAALDTGDYVFASYREHGHAIARGVSPDAVMAELFGKVTGVCRGRGGSMHLFDLEHRFMGGYAIVGGHMPLAAGVALSLVKRGEKNAVLCFLGDGATNIGAFHEAMNITQLWKLPVVFMIVNNQYGMGSRPETVSSVTELWRKAQGYDMIAQRVDGTDVLAMRQATEEALEHAKDRRQPSLIEAVCYRYRGHSMADPARYRSDAEVQEWMRRDPIERYQAWLSASGLLSDGDLEQLEANVAAEVEASVTFAENSPFPDASELQSSLYA